MKFIGIIPARYASTRFPGKPLAEICGKTMIRRVYEQAMRVLDTVVAIGVHTDMFVMFALCEPICLVHPAQVGYHAPREKHCFVRLLRENHFRCVGVFQIRPCVFRRERLNQCSNFRAVGIAVGFQKATLDGFYLFGLNKRLIALNVDNHGVSVVLLSV